MSPVQIRVKYLDSYGKVREKEGRASVEFLFPSLDMQTSYFIFCKATFFGNNDFDYERLGLIIQESRRRRDIVEPKEPKPSSLTDF